jgi:hypothetical protein
VSPAASLEKPVRLKPERAWNGLGPPQHTAPPDWCARVSLREPALLAMLTDIGSRIGQHLDYRRVETELGHQREVLFQSCGATTSPGDAAPQAAPGSDADSVVRRSILSTLPVAACLLRWRGASP